MNLLFNAWLVPALTLTLALYWLAFTQPHWRQRFLTVLALAVLALYQPEFVAASLILVALVFTFPTDPARPRRFWFWLFCTLIFSLTAKYGYELFVGVFRTGDFAERYLLMPLGVSYFCLRLVGLLVDAYRGQVNRKSWGFWLDYLFFLPLFPAGPLESFRNFAKAQSAHFEIQQFSCGLRRVLWGYFKKLVIIGLVFNFVIDAANRDYLNNHASGHWRPLFFVFSNFIRAYLDLSSYSDLAIGFSALFGFRIMENFHAPFLSPNLSQFWRRWHISLSSWCRDYVYFPTFGWTRNLLISSYASMLVMGAWHRLNFNWLIWGIYHGTGLGVVSVYHRAVRHSPRTNYGLFKILGIASTLIFVAIGYAFVSTPDLASAWQVIADCFR